MKESSGGRNIVGFEEDEDEFDSDDEYEKATYLIANHIYLIYELLYLNVVREIDYTDIKHFAINNNEFVKFIFKQNFKEFSIEVLDSWTQIHIDVLECAMYRSGNRYNKHIYH